MKSNQNFLKDYFVIHQVGKKFLSEYEKLNSDQYIAEVLRKLISFYRPIKQAISIPLSMMTFFFFYFFARGRWPPS